MAAGGEAAGALAEAGAAAGEADYGSGGRAGEGGKRVGARSVTTSPTMPWWPKRSLASNVTARQFAVAASRRDGSTIGHLHALCWLVRSVSCAARAALEQQLL